MTREDTMEFPTWRFKQGCPECASLLARRSKRRGFLEKTLMVLLPFRPYRCHDCQCRFYSVAGRENATVSERRRSPRTPVSIPMNLKFSNGHAGPIDSKVLTADISRGGVRFFASWTAEPGTPIEIEMPLLDSRLGRSTPARFAKARILRVQPATSDGWFGVAAVFEESDTPPRN
jgi:hypothetical protein